MPNAITTYRQFYEYKSRKVMTGNPRMQKFQIRISHTTNTIILGETCPLIYLGRSAPLNSNIYFPPFRISSNDTRRPTYRAQHTNISIGEPCKTIGDTEQNRLPTRFILG